MDMDETIKWLKANDHEFRKLVMQAKQLRQKKEILKGKKNKVKRNLCNRKIRKLQREME